MHKWRCVILIEEELYAPGGGYGREDTVPRSDGLVYASLADGSAVCFSPELLPVSRKQRVICGRAA